MRWKRMRQTEWLLYEAQVPGRERYLWWWSCWGDWAVDLISSLTWFALIINSYNVSVIPLIIQLLHPLPLPPPPPPANHQLPLCIRSSVTLTQSNLLRVSSESLTSYVMFPIDRDSASRNLRPLSICHMTLSLRGSMTTLSDILWSLDSTALASPSLVKICGWWRSLTTQEFMNQVRNL